MNSRPSRPNTSCVSLIRRFFSLLDVYYIRYILAKNKENCFSGKKSSRNQSYLSINGHVSSQFSEGVDCVYLSFRPVPFPSMPAVLSRRSAVPRPVRVHATLRGSRSGTVAGNTNGGARKTSNTDPTNSEAGQTAGYKTLDRRRSQHQSRLTSLSCTTHELQT